MASKKNEVAIKETSNELAIEGVDFLDDVGSGMEGTDKESFAIPFLTVLQKISPQVDEAEPEYIEGAKGGMFLNTVNQRLYDGEKGVIFLPCAYQRRFIHWGPRGGDGGGFKGEMLPEEATKLFDNGTVKRGDDGKLYFPKDDGSIDTKKCDYLSDARNHFGILVDEETGMASRVLLSLTSTQIKKSKQLMSMLDEVKVKGPNGYVTPPTWANRVRLTRTMESNDQGSWYGIKPVLEGFVTEASLYQMGKDFHKTIASGEAKVNYEAAAAAQGNESDDKF